MPIIKAVVFLPLEITTLLHSAVRVRMHVEGVISFSCTLTLIATDFLSLHHLQVCSNMFNVYSTAETFAKI